jgi:predicted ABC-class ATPase
MELRESQKETDKRLKETDKLVKKNAKQMKEADKRVGELTGRFGDIVEHMIVPNLVARFQYLKFTFTKVARDVKITDAQKRVIAEMSRRVSGEPRIYYDCGNQEQTQDRLHKRSHSTDEETQGLRRFTQRQAKIPGRGCRSRIRRQRKDLCPKKRLLRP